MSPDRWLCSRIVAVFAFVLTAAGAAMAQSGPAAMSATVYASPT